MATFVRPVEPKASEPVVDKNGVASPIWFKFWSGLARWVQSVESALTAAQNAQQTADAAEDKNVEQDGRLDTVEAEQVTQNNRLTSAESVNTSQNASISALQSGKLDVGANAASASKWATARTITLGGDLSGSVVLDGSGNVTLSGQVANDSHTHAFANMTGKPTTVAGYGITDAYTKGEVDAAVGGKVTKAVIAPISTDMGSDAFADELKAKVNEIVTAMNA